VWSDANQSAFAFEQINSENDYDPAFRNGWVSEVNRLPVPLYKSHDAHSINFSGGSENDTGLITGKPANSLHHGSKEEKDPFSINYISNN